MLEYLYVLIHKANIYANLFLCVVTAIYAGLVYLSLIQSKSEKQLLELKNISKFIIGALEKINEFNAGIMCCHGSSYEKFKKYGQTNELFSLMEDKFYSLANFMRENTYYMNDKTRNYWVENRVKIIGYIEKSKKENKQYYFKDEESKIMLEFIENMKTVLRDSHKIVVKQTEKVSSIKLDEIYGKER